MYAELARVRAELCAKGQLFEIEEVDVRGIRVRAWKHAAPSLRDFWLQTAGHGEATYLVYGDERWSYRQAHEEVSRIARFGALLQPGFPRRNNRQLGHRKDAVGDQEQQNKEKF